MKSKIVYVPLGSTWRIQLYKDVLLEAASIYELERKIINLSFPLEGKAYNPGRRQFDALVLLDLVFKLEVEEGPTLRMGITAADIYVPRMNFIFGIADSSRGCAVLSVARLTYAQYDVRPELLKERVLKEAAHEIGHLLEFDHCKDPYCLLSFSNSIQDVDTKKPKLCAKCQSILQRGKSI